MPVHVRPCTGVFGNLINMGARIDVRVMSRALYLIELLKLEKKSRNICISRCSFYIRKSNPFLVLWISEKII